jgi:hypothetical protein
VLLKLLTLSIQKIKSMVKNFDADDFLYFGFCPGFYKEKLNPTIAYRSYCETYIERDLKQLIQVNDLDLFNGLFVCAQG